MRKIPHFSPEEMQEMEAQMVREIPQLSPETMQEMERQHQALLAAYAEKKERLMQGDMTVLEDAFARLLTERERKIIEMAYGIGMPKMTVGQIAESQAPFRAPLCQTIGTTIRKHSTPLSNAPGCCL